MFELGYDDILIACIGGIGIFVISYWLEKIYERVRHISHVLGELEQKEKGAI